MNKTDEPKNKRIFYRLMLSGGSTSYDLPNWSFVLGTAVPDGLPWYVFDDGTLFQPGHPTSYAADTPEGAIATNEARAKFELEQSELRFKSAEAELQRRRNILAELEDQRSQMLVEGTHLTDCQKLVGEFFKEDVDKICLWFKSKNPLLGELSPNDLIAMRRTGTLLTFIRQQVSDNNPTSMATP